MIYKDKVNQALKNAKIHSVMIATVAMSYANKNIMFTTTENTTAKELLKHKDLSVTGTSTWCWGSVLILLWRNREARTCQESQGVTWGSQCLCQSDDEMNFHDPWSSISATMICNSAVQIQLIDHSNPSTVTTSQASRMMAAHEGAAAQLRCERVMTSTVTQMQLSVRSVFFCCSTDHTECTWYTHTQSMMISFEGLSLVSGVRVCHSRVTDRHLRGLSHLT